MVVAANSVGGGGVDMSPSYKLFNVSRRDYRSFDPRKKKRGRPSLMDEDIREYLKTGGTAVLKCPDTGLLKGFRTLGRMVESADFLSFSLPAGTSVREAAKLAKNLPETGCMITGNESSGYVVSMRLSSVTESDLERASLVSK